MKVPIAHQHYTDMHLVTFSRNNPQPKPEHRSVAKNLGYEQILTTKIGRGILLNIDRYGLLVVALRSFLPIDKMMNYFATESQPLDAGEF